METIRDTITQVMRRLKTKSKKTPDDAVRALLRHSLTKKEKKHAGFGYFNKGTLLLNVDSSAWLYQLSLRKEQLLNKLRRKSNAIKNVVFRIGENNEKE